MSQILTSPPALEPISLAEAKAHLRVDGIADDILISALIATSRQQIEAALDLALIHQTWSVMLDGWPLSGAIELPLSPVFQLNFVRTFDGDDIPTPMPLASLQLDTASRPPRVLRKASLMQAPPLRAHNSIEINFIAGFGALPTLVPAAIRQALLLLVGHWYDNRNASDAAIPDAITVLLAPFRQPKL